VQAYAQHHAGVSHEFCSFIEDTGGLIAGFYLEGGQPVRSNSASELRPFQMRGDAEAWLQSEAARRGLAIHWEQEPVGT
jgi:hypothetical protein